MIVNENKLQTRLAPQPRLGSDLRREGQAGRQAGRQAEHHTVPEPPPPPLAKQVNVIRTSSPLSRLGLVWGRRWLGVFVGWVRRGGAGWCVGRWGHAAWVVGLVGWWAGDICRPLGSLANIRRLLGGI